MTQVQVAEYAGRHRGEPRAVVPITEHLVIVEGLYRQVSVSTGRAWWSVDGNTWQASPVVMGRRAVVTS